MPAAAPITRITSSIDPALRIAARVVDTRLCLAGLAFDKTYNVTLKTGLPSSGGDKLTEAETVPVELRDKPSLVRFSGGIILPRENAAGVPVTTVNIEKLSLKIIRVGDRLLSQIETGTVDNTTLYGWDAKQLENNQGTLVWSGTMAVDNVKNDSVVTLIPIHDILKGKPPGAYVLVAQDAAKKPGQWTTIRRQTSHGDAMGGGFRHGASPPSRAPMPLPPPGPAGFRSLPAPTTTRHARWPGCG